MKKYDYIFFDLDGTITQSEFGIIRSARYALSKMDIDTSNESDSQLQKFIGPPLHNSFTDYYGMSDEEADEAVRLYREFYEREGIFDAPLFEGIKEVAQSLSSQGKKLFVVTSKPQVSAQRIIEYFELNQYYTDIIGPDKSEKSPKKKQLIERAISENGINDKALVIMIGDRKYDIEGADEAGVDSIGVLYGYGSLDELKEAGATYIAEHPLDILSIIKE